MLRSLLPAAALCLLLTAELACTGGGEEATGPDAQQAVPGVPPVAAQPVAERVVVLLVPGLDPDLVERWLGDLPNFNRLAPGRRLVRLSADVPLDGTHVAGQLATGTVQGRSGAMGGPPVEATGMRSGAAAWAEPTYAVPTFWERAAASGVPTRALWVSGPVPQGAPAQLWQVPAAAPGALPPVPMVIRVGGGDPPVGPGLGSVVRAEGEGPWTLSVPLPAGGAWTVELSQPRVGAFRLALEGVRVDVVPDSISPPVALPLPAEAGGGFVLTRVSAVSRGEAVDISLVGAGRVPGTGAEVTAPAAYAEEYRRYHGELDTTGGAEAMLPAVAAGLVSPASLAITIEDELRHRSDALVEELGRRDARLVVAALPQPGLAGRVYLGYADPNHPAWEPEAATSYGGITKSMYVRLDALLGQVRGALQPDDRLLIVSGHGTASARREVDLNQVLLGAGGLDRAEPGATIGVDLPWTGVRAWSSGAGLVWVHSRDRFAQGTVSGRDEARLRANLLRAISRVEVDRERVVDRILTGEEALPGLPAARRPDYVVVFEEGTDVSEESYAGVLGRATAAPNAGPITGGVGSSDEDQRGFVLASYGPVPDDAHAADVAPTVLNLLGVPGADQLDGVVWTTEAAAGGAEAPTP